MYLSNLIDEILSCLADFVLNLIKKQKPAEAVTFICAYELADKIPPVDLLRESMQNVEMPFGLNQVFILDFVELHSYCYGVYVYI